MSSIYKNMSCQAEHTSSQALNMSSQTGKKACQVRDITSQARNKSSQAGNISSRQYFNIRTDTCNMYFFSHVHVKLYSEKLFHICMCNFKQYY